jgi:hypothetical protein
MNYIDDLGGHHTVRGRACPYKRREWPMLLPMTEQTNRECILVRPHVIS